MTQPNTPNRRDTLAAMAGLTGAATLVATPAANATPDAHSAQGKTLSRIAFGSCAKQDKDQPIWDAIRATNPDVFILLGDNVYLDTRDPAVMTEKYAMLAAKPGFKRFREEVPILAIWDDHDYGENDAGREYPMKEEARRQFCDFWGEAATSPRRSRDGIYTSYVFGPRGRKVQVILPDLRWNRTPIRELDLAGTPYDSWAKSKEEASLAVPGPYQRIPDSDATMLGETQWRWLEDQLAVPADVRVLASSLQVVADFPGWEAWINYARDHQRLVSTIRDKKANGLVCISGDTHYGEFSRLDDNVPYPLWDITSSGLTEVWPVLPPNERRVGPAFRDRNFGMIEIDWSRRSPRLTTSIRNEAGVVQLSQVIDTADLRVSRG